MDSRSEHIRSTFNGLRGDTLHILEDFYDEAVVFEDPLGRIEGLPALTQYYGRLYQNVSHIRFDFSNELIDGDQHLGVWTMHLQAAGLNKGREIQLEGCSLIRFGPAGKVVYHRDYFDLGAFVYEQIPLLKHILPIIKNRLKGPH